MAASLASSTATSPTTIYVGHSAVERVFREEISKVDGLAARITVEADPLCATFKPKEVSVIFGRDLRVSLPSGRHLIPYMHKVRPSEIKMQSWFPLAEHLSSVKFSRGFGFDPEFAGKAAAMAEESHTPYKLGRTTIEGGNCFLFEVAGRPKAIVGMNSLLLTLVGLEEQGYFEEKEAAMAEKVAAIDSIPVEFLLMARNRLLFEAKAALELRIQELHEALRKEADNPERAPSLRREHAECCEKFRAEFGPASTFMKSVLEPISAAKEAEVQGRAKILFAKWKMAQELIAEELEIPFEPGKVDEAVGFVFQNNYHIDLEMLVASGGRVFCNDPDKVKRIVEGAAEGMRSKDRPMAFGYIPAAGHSFISHNTAILAKLGCTLTPLPGFFPHETSPVNFMNGLFFESAAGPYFFTLNESDRLGLADRFREEFRSTLADKAADIHLVFLAGVEGVFADTNGGLRCLTFERKVVSA